MSCALLRREFLARCLCRRTALCKRVPFAKLASLVSCSDIRDVAAELITVSKSLREFVRYTGPRRINIEIDMDIIASPFLRW